MSPAEILMWRDRTKAADERGYFDSVDDADANAWDRCAIGEQAKMFPKVVIVDACWGDPRDRVLENLGGEFGDVVRDSYCVQQGHTWYTKRYERPILRAYELLDLIEARVMVLKARARHAA